MMVALGVLLSVAAVFAASRELRAYRERDESIDGGDLFVYTRARLLRRLVGLVVLLALGITLVGFELAPPDEASAAGGWVAAFLIEVLALIVVAVLDLRETSKTARVGRPPS